jgi:TFA2 Winged helix domain 2
MSNQYGFDFLRSEHLLNEDDENDDELPTVTVSQETGDEDGPSASAEVDFERAQNKPDLEKQYDILAFLQAHRGSGSCLAPSVIYKATGIDLDINPTVASMLERNPKIRVEMVPDPENPALSVPTYAYQAKYSNVRDFASLLAQINRMSNGIPVRDLVDSYSGVEKDIQELITAGEVIAIANTEDKDRILFPRGEDFLVELDGIVSVAPAVVPDGSSPADAPVYYVEVDVDPRTQIRRGEAIQVGGQWFRVSSAVREGVPLAEQPGRAQAPLSVVSLSDLSKRNEVEGYVRNFSSKLIPLDGPLSAAAQENIRKSKRARELLSKAIHGTSAPSGSAGAAGGGGSAGGGGGGHRLLSSGVTQQLLGNLAHSANPTSLLAAANQSTLSSNRMKRKAPSFSVASTSSSSGVAATASASASSQAKLLAAAASDPSLYLYRHTRRHGTTTDVRQMYLETRDLVPDADADLHALLLQHRLIEPGEPLRRPRLASNKFADGDGKPKKRRYYERKNQRMTNTHLEGTEIGALLALATEKQKQGQSVGDGGM